MKQHSENNGVITGPAQPGRKPAMGDAAHEALEVELTERALNINCVQTGPDKRNAYRKVVQRFRGLNSLAEVADCERTIDKHCKLAGAIKISKACIKAKARAAAIENIRNPISLMCAINYIFRLVSPELFFSSDDTSILINRHEKPSVLVTQRAMDLLETMNIAPSVTEDVPQQRVLTFNCTISAGFKLICTVIKVVDRLFAAYSEKPYVAELEEGLYVICYACGMNEVLVNQYMYQCCIEPSCEREKQKLIQENLKTLTPLVLSVPTQSSQQSEPGPAIPEIPIDPAIVDIVNERFKYMCLSSDGAYAQIRAIQDSVMARCVRKGKFILWNKYGGGCSMTQSPNDNGRHHAILKKLFIATAFKYGDDYEEPSSTRFRQFKTDLQAMMEPASFRTIWKAIAHCRVYLDKAFSKANIQGAFRDTGIYPYNPTTMLTKCNHFAKLNDEKAAWLLNEAVPKLHTKFAEFGFVSEEQFEEVLSQKPGVDNCKEVEGMQLNNMVLSRQRCFLFSHPEYVKVVNERRIEQEAEERRKEAEKVRVEQERIARGEDPAGTKKVCYARCSNTLSCNRSYPNADKTAWTVCAVPMVETTSNAKKCTLKFCKSPGCVAALMQHRQVCK
jgi:hypothetical protein